MSQHVRYEFSEDTAVIRIDAGKVNALSMQLMREINDALDQAEQDNAKAIAIIGRQGKFSAGFDLSVMRGSLEGLVELLTEGARLAMRIYSMPVSVVAGVTGHAVAMGAVLLFTADERIGAEGDFKIGLNEVAIGMALPKFATLLAQDRLDRRYIYRATSAAELFSPQGAVEAGFLDRTVPATDVAEVAVARAREMAKTLDTRALAETKLRLRADKIAELKVIVSEMRAI